MLLEILFAICQQLGQRPAHNLSLFVVISNIFFQLLADLPVKRYGRLLGALEEGVVALGADRHARAGGPQSSFCQILSKFCQNIAKF